MLCSGVVQRCSEAVLWIFVAVYRVVLRPQYCQKRRYESSIAVLEIAAEKAVVVVVLRMTVMAVVVTAGGVGSGGGVGGCGEGDRLLVV